jgi:hypothetical protein
MANGDVSVLVEISGVDDLVNDDDVTVAIYNGVEANLRTATKGEILPYVTHTVFGDPLYQNVWKARIRNGVLTSKDTRDVRVRTSHVHTFPHSAMFLSDGRLRLEVKPDGSAVDGYVGGYADINDVFDHTARENNNFGRYTCTGMYHAVLAGADGYPDPRTGKCTMISDAWHIKAIPAFLLHGGAGASDRAWQKNSNITFVTAIGNSVAGDGDIEMTPELLRVEKVRQGLGLVDVDDLTDQWKLDFVTDDSRQGEVCDIKQERARFTAACGPSDQGRSWVPVQKKGDRLTWQYQAGDQAVSAQMKLISASTMKGTLTEAGKTDRVALIRPYRVRALRGGGQLQQGLQQAAPPASRAAPTQSPASKAQ